MKVEGERGGVGRPLAPVQASVRCVSATQLSRRSSVSQDHACSRKSAASLGILHDEKG